MQRIGPYSLLEEIARGGQGVVYRALDAEGRAVALKLLLAHGAEDALARKRFQVEVSALTRLRHPHVVSILAAGEHEGYPWLALEFVEGESLEHRLRRGPLPLNEALQIVRQLSEALDYVHGCSLLHRDLKPDNVLLRDDQALLTDFGLARETESSITRITATGVFQGTPGYWAPEQARGQVGLHGPCTDLYGLGAVLYACLTGNPPVQASSLQDFMQSIRFSTTPPPRKVRPEVPAWLSELCMRCLAVDPAARPASAEEVTRALCSGGPPPKSRTPPRLMAALAGAGALTAIGLAAWVAQTRSAATRTDAQTYRQRDQAQTHLDLAIEAWDANRFEDVVHECDLALALDPELGLAWSYRGAGNRYLDRLEEALADLDHAVRLIPNHAPAYANRGDAKAGLERFDEAIRDYDTAIELDPRDPFHYSDRARAKTQLGLYAEALEDYDRALALDSQSAATYLNRGAGKANLDRHHGAIEDYNTTLDLDPRNAVAYAKRAVSKIRLGDLQGALDDNDTAIHFDPSLAVAYLNRATLRRHMGRHQEAIEDYDKVLELGLVSAMAHAYRGASKADLGHYAEAVKDFDAAIRFDPAWCAENETERYRAAATAAAAARAQLKGR